MAAANKLIGATFLLFCCLLTSKGHRLPLGPVVAYNCQSLRRKGRLDHILHEMKFASIICSTGTRFRAKDAVAIKLLHQKGFVCISAGYGKNANSHAGSLIALNRIWWYKKHTSSFAYTTGRIQGRGLAVRLKRGQGDWMPVAACAAPFSRTSCQSHSGFVRLADKIVPEMPSKAFANLGRRSQFPCGHGVHTRTMANAWKQLNRTLWS